MRLKVDAIWQQLKQQVLLVYKGVSADPAETYVLRTLQFCRDLNKNNQRLVDEIDRAIRTLSENPSLKVDWEHLSEYQ